MSRSSLWVQTVSPVLACLALALATSCGGSPEFCGTVANLLTPATGYAATLPPLQVGSPVSVTPTTTANGPITTATVTSGTLPPGLTLGPDGTLSGTPTTPGVFPVTITLSNATGGSVAAPVTLVVAPATGLALTYPSPVTFPSGTAIATQTGTVANPIPGLPVTYTITAGALPAGLTLNADGTLTGTPTTAGASTFTITAANGSLTAAATLTYTITGAAPDATYAALTTSQADVLSVVPASSGAAIVSSSLASGALPPGVTLNTATGVLSGAPTASGVFTAQITNCDATNTCTTAPVTITVNPAGTVPLTGTYTDASGTAGTAMTAVTPVLTVGGPVTSAVLAGGTLPAGMVLNATTGAVSGTPTSAGVFPVLITLADASGGLDTLPLTLTVNSTGATALIATYTPAGTGGSGASVTPAASGLVGTALSVPPSVTAGGPATGATLTGGSLPPGMTLNPVTGTISGTPTAAGTYQASITLVNASGAQTTIPETITVNAATVAVPLVAAYTNATGTVGTAQPAIAPALSSGGPVTGATLVQGSLPQGLTMAPGTGIITGTPTASGTFMVQIQLCAASGACTVQPLVITINPAAAPTGTLSAAYPTPETFTQGTAIATQACTVANGTPGATTTFALANGSTLPAGLILNADGTITGTPATAGVTAFTVTATSGARSATTATVTYTVVPSAAMTAGYVTPMTFTQGQAIATQACTVANPTPGVTTTFALANGSTLPAGLTLNADGTITGTPATAGVTAFTVTATSGARSATTATVTYTVVPSAAMTAGYVTPMTFTQGQAIATQACTVANPTPGVTTTFALANGSTLPAGLTLNANGTITGTPTATGVTPFTVTATSALRSATTATVSYTVISASAMTASYPTPQTFTQGTAIATQACTVANATPGVTTTFALANGSSLPAGLILNANGTITGTPTATGVTSFTVTATSGTLAATTSAVIYTVVPSGAMTASYPTPQTFTKGLAIATQTCTVANPTPGATSTFALANGSSLPGGLTLNSDGTITGTPTATGVTTFTVTATSAARSATTATVSYTVNAMTAGYPTPVTFPQGIAIAAQACTVANGPGGVTPTFALANGSTLPAGLTLNADGTITGTPATPGTTAFTVTATAAPLAATTPTVTYIVSPAAPNPVNPVLTTTQNTPLTVTPTNAGGPIASATLAGGALPPGMTLNAATGAISGTPTTVGVYTAQITVCNAASLCVTDAVTITVNPLAGSPLTAAYTNATGTVGTALTAIAPAVTAGGPVTAATLVTGYTLPSGLTLAPSTGLITGTPGAAGAFPLLITLANASGDQLTVPLTLTVSGPAASALAAAYTSASGTLGTPMASVSPNVTAHGPVTGATLTTGVLPLGLTLDPVTGVITGTPMVAGTFPLGITLVNASGSEVTVPVTLTINTAGTPLAATYTNATGLVGTALTPVTPTPTSGGPVTTATLVSGSLPPGTVALSATTGAITGTPSAPGTYQLQILLGNAGGAATLQPLTLTIDAPLPTDSYPNLVLNDNTAGTDTPVNTGGAITNAILVSGSIPTGMTLNPDGTLSGTPTAPGFYTLTVQDGNAAGTLPSTTFTVTVLPASALSLAYANQTFTLDTAIATQNPAISNVTPLTTATYAVTAGSLPPGLTLNANGTITGTPTSNAGSPYIFTVTATNGTLTDGVTARSASAVNVVYTILGDPNPVLTLTGNTGGTSTTTAGLHIAYLPNPATSFAGDTVVVSTNAFTIPGGGGSAVITAADSTQVANTITGWTGVVPSTGYTTLSQPADDVITYTLTVTNGLGATFTSAVSVKWVSQTTTVAVSTSGSGTIYSGSADPDSPLYNTQVVVPSQTVSGGPVSCGASTLTITAGGTLPAVPAGVYAYSPVFTLATDVSYPFGVPVTVTLPYNPNLPTLPANHLGGSDLPVPFYWDATFGKWEAVGLKNVDISATAGTVTFTTLLQGPYAVLGIPGLSTTTGVSASVQATSTSTTEAFASGVDDWKQWNQGGYANPGGSSLGMSSFAAWYGPMWKWTTSATTYGTDSLTGLYNQYKSGSALESAFASDIDVNAQALISRLANGTMASWNTMWQQMYWANSAGTMAQVNYGLSGIQTGQALLTGLAVTGQPQIFLMADQVGASATNATATAIYGYSYTGGVGTFTLLDPNYPGVAGAPLTINWAPGTGVFSNYDKGPGYNPAMAQFAYEGQTSIHQLVDYGIAFAGATEATAPSLGFTNPPFAAIALNTIGNAAGYSSQTGNLSATQMVGSPDNVIIQGSVTNGTATPSYVLMSVNGGTRVAAPVTANAFQFTIASLPNQYGTPVSLETTEDPCDPTFTQSGFQLFNVATLQPWFRACFENDVETRTAIATPSGSSAISGFSYTGSPATNPLPANITPPVSTPAYASYAGWSHEVAAGTKVFGATMPGYPVDAWGNFVGVFGADGEIYGNSASGGTFNSTGTNYGYYANLTSGSTSSKYLLYNPGFCNNYSGEIVGGELYNAANFSTYAFASFGNYGGTGATYPAAYAGLDPHAHQAECGLNYIDGSVQVNSGGGNHNVVPFVPYLPMAVSGSYSYRINDDWNGGGSNIADADTTPLSNGNPFHNLSNSGSYQSAERLVQTIMVPTTITEPQLTFYWAAVVQAAIGSHPPPARPYVDIIVQDMGTGASPVWQNAYATPITTTSDPVPTTSEVVASHTYTTGGCYPALLTNQNTGNIYYHHFFAGDPTFSGWAPDPTTTDGLANASEWVSIPWQKMNLNMKPWAGHWVRVIVAAADCTATGHAGYAYVDNLTCD